MPSSMRHSQFRWCCVGEVPSHALRTPGDKYNGTRENQCYCTPLLHLRASPGDPCEHHDVAGAHPDVVAALVARLAAFQDTAVPQLVPEGCNPVRAPLATPGAPLAWQPCDGPCLSDAHCNFNGVCAPSGACECAPGWLGFRCGQLDVSAVDPSDGLNRLPASSSWGGSVVFAPEDGRYHLFYSQMLRGCGLSRWTTNSACWHAVGDAPTGPFGNESEVGRRAVAPVSEGAGAA